MTTRRTEIEEVKRQISKVFETLEIYETRGDERGGRGDLLH